MDTAQQKAQPTRNPFFDRTDWLAFASSALVSGAVYIATLAPTVTLEDSGELAVAGDHLGVPHPPGYPIWTLIAWLFARVFSFVQFRGQPNPAWSMGLASAVFGALAAGLTAMLVCRSGRDMLGGTVLNMHRLSAADQRLFAWVGGVLGSLAFAFSPVMWSQSTIIEVYALNAFFLMLVFLLSYRWGRQPSDAVLFWIAFMFGLGLTNYQVLLLAAAPLAVLLLLRDPALLRDMLIAACPLIGIAIGLQMEWLPGITRALSLPSFVYLGANLLGLALVWFCLPRGRAAAIAILLAQIGVAFYAYMPLVSDLRNPPMNWAYPRTWDGFIHAILRGQYAELVPANILSASFIDQLDAYFTDLRGQFTLPVALLGFLPMTLWQVTCGKRRLLAIDAAIALSIVSALLLFVHRLTPGEATLRLDQAGVAAVLTLTAIGVFILAIGQYANVCRATLDSVRAGRWAQAVLPAAGLLAGLTVAVGYAQFLIRKSLSASAADAGLSSTLLALALVPFLVAACVGVLMRMRMRLRLLYDAHSQDWLVTTGLAFFILSVFLIVLANPQGDVQDNFVQRVKFISSHAFFAIWIGYGLIFGAARMHAWMASHRAARALLCVAAMSVALIPIMQNAWNTRLIALSGGAEQNGHDFGWQFGNYQLRGAAAISEELEREEPLPDPFFPRAMDRDAIFFGGTDPGRFVPTYMIYSAQVRPDVYLITQNALADRTFLQVTRDLYGDRIWIPSLHDSEAAFNTYTLEVQNGKRASTGQLTVEDGRIRVTGIHSVMQINGILAGMIFDHERHRRSFYVEESFPIPWMYPYLTPHGLIMKLNSDPSDIEAETHQDDTDFWDWYTRRLHGAMAFRRDVVARKTFSKLRSAIAGLYAERGMFDAAEAAFAEARLLYPYSPEATLRPIQSVHVPQKRYAEAHAHLRRFITLDPRNSTATTMLTQLEGIIEAVHRLTGLETRDQQKTLSYDDVLTLAALHYQLGNIDRYLVLMDRLVTEPQTPHPTVFKAALLHKSYEQYEPMHTALQVFEARLAPGVLPVDYRMRIANMYADAGMLEVSLRHMTIAAKQQPGNWRGWLDISLLNLAQHQTNAAFEALRTAFSEGGQDARNAISDSPQLIKLLEEYQ